MVTRIYQGRRRRLFLREHREAKEVSATTMAGRLGIERESVYRLERNPYTMDFHKQIAYAEALGIEPEDLWRPPGTPSLDGLVAEAPDELRRKAAEMITILLRTGT
jgi:DNA-binding XRE family transcriptional regulator